jgi:hypothetical protein
MTETLLTVKCAGSDSRCRRRIADVVQTSGREVLTDGQHTYQLPFDFAFVNGCRNHSRGHLPLGAHDRQRLMVIAGDTISKAMAAGHTELLWDPDVDSQSAAAAFAASFSWGRRNR